MLMYNIDFELAGIAISIVLLVFLFIQSADTPSVREYKKVVIFNLLAAVFDAVTVFFYTYPSSIPLWLNYLINSLCFICGFGEAFSVLNYAIVFIETREKRRAKKWLKASNAMAFVIYSSLFILNAFVPVFFSFDKEGNYQRVGIYPLVFVMPAVYILLAAIYLFNKRRFLTWKQTFTAVFFAIATVTGMGLQLLVFRDVFLTYFFSTVGIMALSYSLETPDYIRLMRTMRELRDAKEEAERATRAKDNFLANMSHEIRTPLNAILGIDEIILRDGKDEPTRMHARDIKIAGNSLLSIINQILDFSKVESGKMDIINAEYSTSDLFYEVVNMTKLRALGKGIKFTMDVDPNLPERLYGDELRIRQILLNLINNAIKYTKEGGVTVKVTFSKINRIRKENSPHIELKIAIKDTGIGIREEDKVNLFKSFKRLDETRNRNIEGTGLGLILSKQLIDLMDGELDVESVYGKGSEFTVKLIQKVVNEKGIGDLSDAFKKVSERVEVFEPSLIAPDARILIVDDNEMNLSVLSDLLDVTKMRIETIMSGFECIEKCRQNKYDLILLDQMMPEMDGSQTLEKMKQDDILGDTPVIVLTADAVVGARETYLSLGFDDYLSKPVRYEELERMLYEYLPDEKVSKKQTSSDSSSEKPSVVVVAKSSEALKEQKSKLKDYRATLVHDKDQAKKYMEKHEVDFVLLEADEYK